MAHGVVAWHELIGEDAGDGVELAGTDASSRQRRSLGGR